MASPKQIEDLKRGWLQDPCWDIEDTEGFAEHKQELYIFRLETELKQCRAYNSQLLAFRMALKKFIED